MSRPVASKVMADLGEVLDSLGMCFFDCSEKIA
jgi:hypothetical protein